VIEQSLAAAVCSLTKLVSHLGKIYRSSFDNMFSINYVCEKVLSQVKIIKIKIPKPSDDEN